MAKLTSFLMILAVACIIASGTLFLAAFMGTVVVLSSSSTTFTNGTGTATEFVNGSMTTITNTLWTSVETSYLARPGFAIWGGLLLLVGLAVLAVGIHRRVSQDGHQFVTTTHMTQERDNAPDSGAQSK